MVQGNTHLRILVVVSNLPYPIFSGTDLRNWQNLNGLMSIGRVACFGLCPKDSRSRGKTTSEALVFYDSSKDPKLACRLPEATAQAAGSWLLKESGHPSDFYYSDIVVDEIRTLLSEFKPQVVVLEQLWMHHYLDLIRQHSCRVILDCHNVEALLAQSRMPSTDRKLPVPLKLLYQRTRLIEQKALHSVDQIWTCSSNDAQHLIKLYHPSVATRVIPNALNPHDYCCEGRNHRLQHEERVPRTLIFPAMFAYPPNRDAAYFLIDEIFPRLSGLFPDCCLLLAGSWPTPHMLEEARKNSRIVVTGAVANIQTYLAASSVMLVPLFRGSGTRFKILEAFAAKLPVISTAKGAEGLDVKSEEHLLFAETTSEFIEAIQRLWSDAGLVEKLKASAVALLNQHYSWDVAHRCIRAAIHELEPLERPV